MSENTYKYYSDNDPALTEYFRRQYRLGQVRLYVKKDFLLQVTENVSSKRSF